MCWLGSLALKDLWDVLWVVASLELRSWFVSMGCVLCLSFVIFGRHGL